MLMWPPGCKSKRAMKQRAASIVRTSWPASEKGSSRLSCSLSTSSLLQQASSHDKRRDNCFMHVFTESTYSFLIVSQTQGGSGWKEGGRA